MINETPGGARVECSDVVKARTRNRDFARAAGMTHADANKYFTTLRGNVLGWYKRPGKTQRDCKYRALALRRVPAKDKPRYPVFAPPNGSGSTKPSGQRGG